MALRDEFEKQGNWLFRRRSYLPLLIFPLLLLALPDSENLQRLLGDANTIMYDIFCIVIAFLGLVIRCVTVGYVPAGTSGRNTDEQKADTLNTRGMYSICRHPLYLGNFVTIFGISLFVQSLWFSLITILAFWLYYERIMFAEEEFLHKKFGSNFSEWAEKTPAFIPNPRKWLKPEIPFSIITVLKREYSGFFSITSSFTLLKVLKNLTIRGKLELNFGWAMFFFGGLLVYLTLRTLKKKTKLLEVSGR